MEKELEEIIMKQLVSETLSENEKACFGSDGVLCER